VTTVVSGRDHGHSLLDWTYPRREPAAKKVHEALARPTGHEQVAQRAPDVAVLAVLAKDLLDRGDPLAGRRPAAVLAYPSFAEMVDADGEVAQQVLERRRHLGKGVGLG